MAERTIWRVIPAQTRRRLEARAREQGRPVADVVRDAVEEYLR